MKRFSVYDFVIGNPVLIDVQNRTIAFYRRNLYGQILRLDEPEYKKITQRTINGFLQRRGDFWRANKKELVIDEYIYKYFLTDQQRQALRNKPMEGKPPIIEIDDYPAAIQAMCEWAVDSKDALNDGNTRAQLLQYSTAHLERFTQPPPYTQRTKTHRHDRNARETF